MRDRLPPLTALVLRASLAAALVTACDASPTATVAASCPAGAVCVTGTDRHVALEGGFWAIRGDDGTTYDPLGGLPKDFQQDGLRVRLDARIRTDVGSFHMAGPIVEILALRRL
jgi:hypothetical protein